MDPCSILASYLAVRGNKTVRFEYGRDKSKIVDLLNILYIKGSGKITYQIILFL